MNPYWQHLFIRFTVWIAVEVLLSVIGLDTWADYSEFLFERKAAPVVAAALSSWRKSARFVGLETAIAPALS